MHTSLSPSPLSRYLQASELASWLQVDPESGRMEAHQKVPPRSTFLDGWYITQILAVDNGERVSRGGWGEKKQRGGSEGNSVLVKSSANRFQKEQLRLVWTRGGSLARPGLGSPLSSRWPKSRSWGKRSAHPKVCCAHICLSRAGTPPLTATGTLSIEVLEVNDHAPSLFPTTGSLCRGGAGLVLSAADEDLAPHAGPFRFHLGPSSAHNWTLSHPNGNWASWVPCVMGEGTLTQALGGAKPDFLVEAPPHRAHTLEQPLVQLEPARHRAGGRGGRGDSGSLDFAGHQTG